MTSTTKPYPGTQAVLRAISLLKVFDDEHPQWNLTELAHETGLNKTTTFRLLSALESEGMIARGDSGDNYVLGPEIVVLGGRALRANKLRSISHPKLEQLAAITGETASLEILAGRDMLIIDEVVGEHLVSGVRSIGTRCRCTARRQGWHCWQPGREKSEKHSCSIHCRQSRPRPSPKPANYASCCA